MVGMDIKHSIRRAAVRLDERQEAPLREARAKAEAETRKAEDDARKRAAAERWAKYQAETDAIIERSRASTEKVLAEADAERKRIWGRP